MSILNLIILFNFIIFLIYVYDKKISHTKLRRIPEKTLLIGGFITGGAGALAAMIIFRHKTRKLYFYIINLVGLILMISLLLKFNIFEF